MSDTRTVRLEIKKLVAGGDGLAFLDGKAVFVPLALPGETVEARLNGGRRDYATAELVEVVEASPHRVTPPCPIYAQCGGCNLQHLSYQKQVEEKGLILAEALRRTGGLDLGSVSVLGSVPFAYRNRLQLHFSPEGRVGFMRRSATSVVEAPGCPIAVPVAQAWIEARAGTTQARDELAPHLPGRDRFLLFGYGDELWVEGRDGEVELRVAGEPIRFHVAGFFQSNLHMLERLIPELLEGLSGESAADLYCGVGLFAHFLAPRFAHLTCVEQDRRALALARRNVGGAGREFSAMAVEKWIAGPGAARRFDCVLVDPPRAGLSASVRAWLARAKIRSLLYVSCDPVTLARDLGDLVRSGYRLESLRGFDFYPQTSHVESYARLAWS